VGRRDKEYIYQAISAAVRLPLRAISCVQNIGDRGQNEICDVNGYGVKADCHTDVGEVRCSVENKYNDKRRGTRMAMEDVMHFRREN